SESTHHCGYLVALDCLSKFSSGLLYAVRPRFCSAWRAATSQGPPGARMFNSPLFAGRGGNRASVWDAASKRSHLTKAGIRCGFASLRGRVQLFETLRCTRMCFGSIRVHQRASAVPCLLDGIRLPRLGRSLWKIVLPQRHLLPFFS